MTNDVVMYGIPNCSKVKNAREWLAARDVAYRFVDYKKQAPTAELLQEWAKVVGWDALLNKQGTTWRGLTDEEKAAIQDADDMLAIMLRQPSVIKRPMLVDGETLILGFDIEKYTQHFA
jgi:arsenate reductase (glutaredoxin)